jgi:hypothetical protein
VRRKEWNGVPKGQRSRKVSKVATLNRRFHCLMGFSWQSLKSFQSTVPLNNLLFTMNLNNKCITPANMSPRSYPNAEKCLVMLHLTFDIVTFDNYCALQYMTKTLFLVNVSFRLIPPYSQSPVFYLNVQRLS